MAEGDKVFAGSIPGIYERYLVPLIFAPYAEDLAERVAAFEASHILEVAAGTGVVTRALARLCPTARIVATDLNPAMLAEAEARQPPGTVTFRQADAAALPFPDESFDALVCQFGAMFFPDKPAAYAEARRVLRPGGRVWLSVWGPIEENAFADVVTEALCDRYPDDPPLFLDRTPHGHADPERLRSDLTTAGLRDVAIETVVRTSRAAAAQDAAMGYCQGTPLRAEIEAREPGGLEVATQAATDALSEHYGHDPIEGPMQALVITAVR